MAEREEPKYGSEEYYQSMKDNSMRALRDAEFQASLSKQNALKYTQNALNQTGYANQGLSESTALGIQNNYRNALLGAQQQYRNEIGDINRQQFEYNTQDATNGYNNLVNNMGVAVNEDGTTDVDTLTRVLNNGQVGIVKDENGNETLDFSKTYFTPSQQQDLLTQWQTYMADAPKEKLDYVEPTSDEAKEIGARVKANDGGIFTTFTKGSGKNTSFVIENSKGNIIKLEMGQKANDIAQIKWKGKQIGDVWYYQLDEGKDKGNFRFYVKDQNDVVRIVDNDDIIGYLGGLSSMSNLSKEELLKRFNEMIN